MFFAFVAVTLVCVSASMKKDFVANSIFAHQKGSSFIAKVDGKMHPLTVKQVVASLGNDIVGTTTDLTEMAAFRHSFALKPVENLAVFES